MNTIRIFLLILLVSAACTDAEISKMGGYGDKFKVQLVNCDGSVKHEWISSGKVLSEGGSDGYYFNEEKTGALIEVTGTLIITEIR